MKIRIRVPRIGTGKQFPYFCAPEVITVKPIENLKVVFGPVSGKKAYQKPKLEVFGDLGEITQTVGSMLNNDGGTLTGAMMTG